MCTCKCRQLWSTSEVQGLYYCYMQMEVAVVQFRDCITACTCKWRWLWSLLQKFRDSITACVHANGGSCGLYFRSSGTVLLHVYMQMEVAVVSTSEVQGLYYCMCTCKWRQLWSLLQKFRDCITACVHANGGGCGLYFRSSGTVLLHVYMQMEVAVVATSEVQGLYYCMCTCKWRQLWSLLQKFRDCITACVHANGGSYGVLYFRSSGTVLLHVYMQMEVAVVSTSEVQGLYYCMCTCKWRQLWSLLQKFRDCITACVNANGGSCGLYFRSSGTVLLLYMQMEVATSEVQGLYYCMCTCKWRQLCSSTSEVQGLYYYMCTCKCRQLWSPSSEVLLQKFRDCITACVHTNGGSLWSLLQKFRDCITACVYANGGSCGLYFRSSGTVLLHVYMQVNGGSLWSLLQKFRDCITACVHANGGSCGRYFRSFCRLMCMQIGACGLYFRSSGTV